MKRAYAASVTHLVPFHAQLLVRSKETKRACEWSGQTSSSARGCRIDSGQQGWFNNTKRQFFMLLAWSWTSEGSRPPNSVNTDTLYHAISEPTRSPMSGWTSRICPQRRQDSPRHVSDARVGPNSASLSWLCASGEPILTDQSLGRSFPLNIGRRIESAEIRPSCLSLGGSSSIDTMSVHTNRREVMVHFFVLFFFVLFLHTNNRSPVSTKGCCRG